MNLFSIGEIKVSTSEHVINKLLKEGWVILHINSGKQKDSELMCVLGSPRFNKYD